MGLIWIKLGFTLLVLVTALAGALLPWSAWAAARGERFIALGDSFAGGVLAGAGLIHMLGDGAAGFQSVAPQLEYPVAFLLAGIGFFLILLIEGVIVAGRRAPEAPHAQARAAAASHEIGGGGSGRPRTPYTAPLLLVLSVHSIIAGMALGAQRSLGLALVVFLAIIAHKAVAGFALGVSYRRNGPELARVVPAVAFFSLMTPLGILAGTLLSASLGASGGRLLEAAFDSLAAGTFIYIAALDIIRTEFDQPDDRWQKWLAACAGFGIMALLAIWI